MPTARPRPRPARRPLDDEGATAVEYALLVGLIAVIIISSVTLLGGNISTMFTDIAREFATVDPGA